MRWGISSAAIAALAGVAFGAGVGAASAGGRYHDRVYADSFGNLVVESASGYKRILVGEGRLAKQLQAYTAGDAAEHEHYRPTRTGLYFDNCYRPPVLLKGRSYMYGLDDGVVPEPSGRCPQH